jgi:uncharacterized protein (TIGR02996 family)
MRTFQFSDAKSHKFWTIDVSGSSFTVTYGKVGTAGQAQTKSFPSAEKAQAEAEKLVREKTGKGYRETTPTATTSDAEAFENGLVEHRDEVVRWSAYSDYLAEQGDARGEFMRVQLALEDENLSAAERKALAAQEKKLLKAHEKEWLGPLAAFTVDAEVAQRRTRMQEAKRTPVVHRFERGWLAALNFFNLTVDQARAYAAAPGARLVREVTIEEIEPEAPQGVTQQYIDSYYAPGPDVPADIDPYDRPALHALTRCPHLKAVRVFRLGEAPTPERNGEEYSNCTTSGELAHHFVKQMPFVEEVELYAHHVDANKLFALPMPRLRSLTLYHSDSYPLDKLAANKTLTELTTIRCHPHALDFDKEEPGAYIRLRHLKAICRAAHLTKLTHLCLRLTDFGDDGIEEIVASGLLKRLRVLDLRGGCVSDDGAKVLAASPDLKNLQFLNLRSNALTAAGVAAIKATKVNADVTHQHTATSADDEDGEMPEYLFDGDME